ncbi:hypothetical protein FQZ97_735050 [compost metagenome]
MAAFSLRLSALGDQFLEVGDDRFGFEHQDIAFQGVQDHFGGIADQCAGQAGARYGADYGNRSL